MWRNSTKSERCSIHKMKVATITCHDVYNHGASLQALALQRYVESLGCDYEIIDYKPPYLSGHYSLWQVSNGRYDRPLVKQLYMLAKLPGRLLKLPRKRAFDRFTARYLHKSSHRYNSNEELRQYSGADLYVAGSDQIWNTIFPNGHDDAFYLEFAPASARKISYAASFATDRIYGGAEETIARRLARLDAISVRESSGLALLRELGREDGVAVCDPVFLLCRQQWLQLIDGITVKAPKDYILLYDTNRSKTVREITLALARTTGLPILSVSANRDGYARHNRNNCGPLEFARYISGARFVVSNSFHATAFAVIFNRDFFTINRRENINTRMHDFLTDLGLQNRIVTTPAGLDLAPIDFNAAELRLNRQIEFSKNFLAQQIGWVRQLTR